MSARPQPRTAGGQSLRSRLQTLPERLLFGPRSEQPGAAGRLRRLARYPYALLRDLLGGRLNLHAMGLVYATLLALVPLIAFSFGILKVFNAQGVLQPLVHEFFRPMGAAADQFTERVMEFANKVRGALVGSVGLALLIWTLVGTMKKVEDGLNFVWHVDLPRNFARRMAEYLALLIMGPVLLAAVIGLSRLAADSVPLRLLSQLPWIDRATALGVQLAPYVTVSALLTVLYMAIPNTHVRLRPALAGGITAGILWAAIGRIFTLFVLYSSRLMVVYAGFAIIIAALIWTYLGWIILLLGAQVSFYAQNPTYLRLGLRELRPSCADTERLALSIMYLIGERYRDGGRRLAVPALALRLDCPGIIIARLCAALEAGGFLIGAEDETRLPTRDLAQILLLDGLLAARAHSSGPMHWDSALPARVQQLYGDLESAWQRQCGATTLADLLRPAS